MLDRVDETIERFLKELDDDRVLKLYSDISSGKKLRAKLIIKVSEDFNDSDKICKLAAIVEMVHAASLLHDDVIDEADTRRGSASINALYGDKTAIMLGDILYSKAFFELNSIDKEVAKSISRAVTLLSMGEMSDVELSKSFNPDRKLYFDMIYKKTASLIEASAYSSAYISGKESEKFALYGKNLGLAFQIIDDILDVTQDSAKLGKPAMSDFKEGKTTLPYIILYDKMSADEKKELTSLFKKELNESEKAWLFEMFEKYGAIRDSISEAKKLAKEALESIKSYKNAALNKIVKDMVEREF